MTNIRQSKRKARHVDVPALQEDAGERKRVLNVLAQRRYRERKRQRLEELEAKVKGNHDSLSLCTTPTDSQVLDTDAEALEIPTTDSIKDDQYESHHDETSQSDVMVTESTPSDMSFFFANTSDEANYEMITSTSEMTSPGEPWHLDSSDACDRSFDFPDEVFLPMIELNLLRAGMAIAKRLNVDSMIWDLSSISPFNSSGHVDYEHLPSNLRPTFSQLTIQHHPALDILPWPSVRDKLIFIFSQPQELRPPIARSPTALIDFIYDMEDPTEGMRVTGSDPYAGENWELGEKSFNNWWWAFSKEIINHSNYVRRERGATGLGGTILGEAV